MAKILVVDDRAMNRELVVQLLVHAGHRVLEASDGQEGLALVKAERPAVVISDILMPTMDGYEFVRRMRADPEVATTEVIFYTAHYREREASQLAEACGVFRVLVKPCEPDEILRAVDEALQAPTPPAVVSNEPTAEHLRVLSSRLAEKTAAVRSLQHRMIAMYELGLEFASEADPHRLLEAFCRGARDLIGARYAMVAVGATSGRPAFFAASGMDPDVASSLRPRDVREGSLGQVFSERRSRRFLGPAADPEHMGLPRGFPPIRFALASPLLSLDETFGWVCLADKPGASDFEPGDEVFLSSFTTLVGRVYEQRLHSALVRSELERLKAEIEKRQETERMGAALADRLTHNERRIVRLVADGKSAIEIGGALNLSPRTVETYRARLMHKLGIEDLSSLVKFAIRSGIAPMD